MSTHRYPLSSLLTDGLRAVVGMAATCGPLIFLEPVWPLAVILGVLAVVFSIFALKLLQQSLSSIELSHRGISERGPLTSSLDWSRITSLRLAHYAAPRRPSDGWYQLTVKGGRGTLKINSTIDGFDEIVAAAAEAAETCGIVLDPATSDNLRTLNIKA